MGKRSFPAFWLQLPRPPFMYLLTEQAAVPAPGGPGTRRWRWRGRRCMCCGGSSEVQNLQQPPIAIISRCQRWLRITWGCLNGCPQGQLHGCATYE